MQFGSSSILDCYALHLTASGVGGVLSGWSVDYSWVATSESKFALSRAVLCLKFCCRCTPSTTKFQAQHGLLDPEGL
jgi:hypothetical protein